MASPNDYVWYCKAAVFGPVIGPIWFWASESSLERLKVRDYSHLLPGFVLRIATGTTN